MIAQTGADLHFEAWYHLDGVAVEGLTVTVDVFGPDGTQLEDGASATEIGAGFYTFTLDGGGVDTTGNYRAMFTTAGEVTDADRPSLITVVAWADLIDAAVSTRATPAQVDSSVAAVAGGGGSVPHTETVVDGSGDPLDGVEVVVRTTDNAAETPTARGTTNSFGQVTFQLDPGTYYLTVQLARYAASNPTEIEVTA